VSTVGRSIAGASGLVELAGERLPVGDRQLAGVVAADVGGRLAADGLAVLEQRNSLGAVRVARDRAGDDPVREVTPEHLRRERLEAIAATWRDESDLDDRPQVEVERAEKAAEACRVARHEVGHRPERPRGRGLVPSLPGQDRQPQERLHGDRAAAGHGIVEEVPRTDDQALVVAARVVEPLERLVPEEPQHLLDERAGRVEPRTLEGRLVDLEEGRAYHRVVLEAAPELRAAA